MLSGQLMVGVPLPVRLYLRLMELVAYVAYRRMSPDSSFSNFISILTPAGCVVGLKQNPSSGDAAPRIFFRNLGEMMGFL